MELQTTRFGALTINPDEIVHFPLGLVGFETLNRFVVIDADDVSPMRWLQAVDEPGLSFLVVEPGLFFPEYAVNLTEPDEKVLDVTRESKVVVACPVVIPEDPQDMTINLMGPLVINIERRIGKQVVMHESGYSPRHRLLGDNAPAEEPALV